MAAYIHQERCWMGHDPSFSSIRFGHEPGRGAPILLLARGPMNPKTHELQHNDTVKSAPHSRLWLLLVIAVIIANLIVRSSECTSHRQSWPGHQSLGLDLFVSVVQHLTVSYRPVPPWLKEGEDLSYMNLIIPTSPDGTDWFYLAIDCSTMALNTPQEIQYQLAHAADNRSASLYGTAISMIILTAGAVSLRLGCRWHLKARISYDDITILIAMVLCWGISAMLLLCAYYGSGRHTIFAGIPNLERFLQVEYAFELTYTILITLIKMSILLFYRRVFPSQATMTSFCIAWYGISVWCILWLISTLVAAIFQCYPISFAWTKVATTTKGTCLDFPALLYATAALNIVADIAILLLPMPIVWHLRIQMSQKIAISGVFLLGGFVCVASIIRASYIHDVVTSDPIWTNIDAGIWTVIEPALGITTASLPTMGPLLRKVFPLHNIDRSLEPIPFSVHVSSMLSRSDPEKGNNADKATSRKCTRQRGSTDSNMYTSKAYLEAVLDKATYPASINSRQKISASGHVINALPQVPDWNELSLSELYLDRKMFP